VHIGTQACSALGAAHAAGIVHRDVKPTNILMDDAGQIKIVDFGVAKACRDPAHSVVTASGSVVGTPHFMAPEQMRDSRAVDHRADLYGLAATLHACLTGDVPFPGTRLAAVAAAVLQGKGIRPSSVRPDMPPALERVILRGMAVSPDDRFQTAAEFEQALATVL